MTLSQRIVDNKDLAEALSYWATALGIVIAIIAGILATARAYFEHRQGRWSHARDLYNDHMRLSIDHPEFYCDFWNKEGVSGIQRASYINYVSFLLTAIEDIVTIDGRPEWRNSLLSDLRPHKTYLASPAFEVERMCYFEEVRALIDVVIDEPDEVSNA